MLSPKLSDKLNQFFLRLGRFDKTAKLHEVDFSKPWYNIIFREKLRLIYSFLFEGILIGFLTSVPFLIATSFSNRDMNMIGVIILSWITLYLFMIFRISFLVRGEANIIYSINTSATNYFLATDPINHSTREMGKLIGRVKRSSDSYEGIIDFVIFNIAGLITSIFVSSYLFFQYSQTLGILVGGFIVTFMILGAIFQYFSTRLVYPVWGKADDRFNAISVETISQAPFIRSLFATPIQQKRLARVAKSASRNRAYSWLLPVIAGTFLRILFVISIAIISIFLISEIDNNTIEPIIAVSLIVSYTGIANSLGQFSRNFGKFVDATKRADDLFKYVREYGETTYPSV